MSEHDLYVTDDHLKVLRAIGDHPGAKLGEIAHRCELEVLDVARMLQELLDAGLIMPDQ